MKNFKSSKSRAAARSALLEMLRRDRLRGRHIGPPAWMAYSRVAWDSRSKGPYRKGRA